MSRPTGTGRREDGVTLVELIIAVGLLALLMLSVLNLMRSFLGLWGDTEERRARVEESSGVAELLARDVAALESGPRGDLVAEWVPFDGDGDGVKEQLFPRLVLLRHASRPELARLQAGAAAVREGEGLLEVAWCVLPVAGGAKDPDVRGEGLVLRGERVVDTANARGEASFFDRDFWGSNGRPPADRLNDVSGGVLWLGMQFATQTSILDDGWKAGGDLRDVALSWDAWGRGRPPQEVHGFNEPAAGMPSPGARALLPRRVRFELEFERPSQRKRRPRLAGYLETESVSLVVTDGERLPEEVGAYVKVEGEWMEITSLSRNRAGVRRGARGTRATAHPAGALVHWGQTFVREVPIGAHQEDWNL